MFFYNNDTTQTLNVNSTTSSSDINFPLSSLSTNITFTNVYSTRNITKPPTFTESTNNLIKSSTINPIKLPSQPSIINASFNFENDILFLKWRITNNGGTPINEISVYFELLDSMEIFSNKTIESNFSFK